MRNHGLLLIFPTFTRHIPRAMATPSPIPCVPQAGEQPSLQATLVQVFSLLAAAAAAVLINTLRAFVLPTPHESNVASLATSAVSAAEAAGVAIETLSHMSGESSASATADTPLLHRAVLRQSSKG